MKLVNLKTGISKKTGKGYALATFLSVKTDGSRVLRDFFLNTDLIEVGLLKLDSEYSAICALTDDLQFVIEGLEEVKE